MNRILRLRCLSFAVGMALAAMMGGAFAQTKTLKFVPVRPSNAQSGVDLYHQYCAVCHGVDGRGAGPAADAMKQRPTDLTLLTRHNNGRFPTLEMKNVIQGEAGITAHGNLEMPAWGEAFRSISSSQSLVEMKVQALLKYLEEIQR
jgi:mono/diheme cytochrome c family protein